MVGIWSKLRWGKLCVVIDTALDGATVSRVKVGSLMEGLVFPGDCIVKADEVDPQK